MKLPKILRRILGIKSPTEMKPVQRPHKKVILHLCADIGSDTMPYQNDPDYEVVMVGVGS